MITNERNPKTGRGRLGVWWITISPWVWDRVVYGAETKRHRIERKVFDLPVNWNSELTWFWHSHFSEPWNLHLLHVRKTFLKKSHGLLLLRPPCSPCSHLRLHLVTLASFPVDLVPADATPHENSTPLKGKSEIVKVGFWVSEWKWRILVPPGSGLDPER